MIPYLQAPDAPASSGQGSDDIVRSTIVIHAGRLDRSWYMLHFSLKRVYRSYWVTPTSRLSYHYFVKLERGTLS